MSQVRNRYEWWVSEWSPLKPDAPEPRQLRLTDSEGRTYTAEEDPDPAHLARGAMIADMGAGVTYRALIGGTESSPYLISLDIERSDSEPISSDFLVTVPVDRIASAVAQFLRENTTSKPGEVLIIGPDDVQGRGFIPDLAELAQRYLAHEGKRTVFTNKIAAEYAVSRATVGRWIRRARDAGFLPEANTGRPRIETPETPDTHASGLTENGETENE